MQNDHPHCPKKFSMGYKRGTGFCRLRHIKAISTHLRLEKFVAFQVNFVPRPIAYMGPGHPIELISSAINSAAIAFIHLEYFEGGGTAL